MAEMLGGAVSLEQAIKDKYCLQEEDEDTVKKNKSDSFLNRKVQEYALSHKPGSRPVEKLKRIVLNRMTVESAGDLEGLCPKLEELHLSYNQISHWDEVSLILSSTPSLKFLDLSNNPLDSSTFVLNGQLARHLSTLVLNATGITWEALEGILAGLQQLQELHVSINRYSAITLSPDFQHDAIETIHMNDNQLAAWPEIAKLSPAFPNLRTLVACNNPLEVVPEMEPDVFPSLQVLNLNGCAVSDWTSIENIQTPSQLTELNLLNVPVGSKMDEKQRRQAFVARLPTITKLNKSTIGETEREKAERWLIREAKDSPDPPKVYQDLLEKHGHLEALADVNLGKPKFVRIEFEFEGLERANEEREISVDQTVGSLKKWIGEELVGVPPTNFQLWYGLTHLKDNKKFVYLLRLHDGESLAIVMKT